jgi:Major intrinsic protein
METGEAGFYLFSACAIATLLWHPASPLQAYLANDAVRRMLMGTGMGATIILIVLSPWGKQSGAHFNPAVTLAFFSIRESGVLGCPVLLRLAIRRGGRWRGASVLSEKFVYKVSRPCRGSDRQQPSTRKA